MRYCCCCCNTQQQQQNRQHQLHLYGADVDGIVVAVGGAIVDSAVVNGVVVGGAGAGACGAWSRPVELFLPTVFMTTFARTKVRKGVLVASA